MDPIIIVKNLEKSFLIRKKSENRPISNLLGFNREKVTAVNDLSFEVKAGEIVGYIGLNGAGKSTTLKMLSGLITPTSGHCEVKGLNPAKDRKRLMLDTGVVFGQRSQLWWDLPVIESFKVLKKIYKVDTSKFNRNFDYLNSVLDLSPLANKPVRTLSLGQRMKCEIAGSLLHGPSVLFLDEPTIGLDLITRGKIRMAIRDINREMSTTVMLTSHDTEDINALCSKIIVLERGKIVFDGGIDHFVHNNNKEESITFEIEFANVEGKNRLAEFVNQHSLEISNNDGVYQISYQPENISRGAVAQKVLELGQVENINFNGATLESAITNISSRGASVEV
jgi:ABC-2 type transport system ATP-binding protein